MFLIIVAYFGMKIGAKDGEVGNFLSFRENNGERSSQLFDTNNIYVVYYFTMYILQ